MYKKKYKLKIVHTFSLIALFLFVQCSVVNAYLPKEHGGLYSMKVHVHHHADYHYGLTDKDLTDKDLTDNDLIKTSSQFSHSHSVNFNTGDRVTSSSKYRNFQRGVLASAVLLSLVSLPKVEPFETINTAFKYSYQISAFLRGPPRSIKTI